ncbi:DmpA/ArgJ-like protein [Atractiella rhizophila]|nr:DmpA/ArgJ-like protein [Atractiella rhizophila]
MRIRDLGYMPGQLPVGPKNSILDIKGLSISQKTVVEAGPTGPIVKGVTVILPRPTSSLFKHPVYAAFHVLNGNGELTGSHQIRDWGTINMPIAMCNSLSLGNTFQGLWEWVLSQWRKESIPEDEMGRLYGTPVVGETCDWWLNGIETSIVDKALAIEACDLAASGAQGEVLEGPFGGGAGMTCHEFVAGVGTSSRLVKGEEGKEYVVAAIVQSNYGHTNDLRIGGVPVGRVLLQEKEVAPAKGTEGKADDGSILIYIFTDAPLIPHQLQRLAQRASIGLSQVGSHGSGRNHSGDIFLAVSTGNQTNELLVSPNGEKINHRHPPVQSYDVETIRNESINAVFRAGSEAVEEAILNSLVGGREGRRGKEGETLKLEGLPVEKVKDILQKYLVK